MENVKDGEKRDREECFLTEEGNWRQGEWEGREKWRVETSMKRKRRGGGR